MASLPFALILAFHHKGIDAQFIIIENRKDSNVFMVRFYGKTNIFAFSTMDRDTGILVSISIRPIFVLVMFPPISAILAGLMIKDR